VAMTLGLILLRGGHQVILRTLAAAGFSPATGLFQDARYAG